MEPSERQNLSSKACCPKSMARNLDREVWCLIDLVERLRWAPKMQKAKNVLGQYYEYFLGQFALAEGKKGGSFYTRAAWSNCCANAGANTMGEFRPVLRLRRHVCPKREIHRGATRMIIINPHPTLLQRAREQYGCTQSR